MFLTDDGSKVVTGDSFYPGKVLIIDTEKIYMFDSKTKSVSKILDLDRINSKTDLSTVKQVIRSNLA